MGDIATVVAIEADGNVRGQFHEGGDDVIAEHFEPAGDDSPPLPGDSMAVEEGPGTGAEHVTGYHDPSAATARQAAPGEKRIYSRAGQDVLAATVWLKADGTVLIRSELAPAGGTFEINPATGEITMNGKATVDALGEVKAKTDVAGGVSLTGHMTPSPMGPLGPPVPGT